MSFKKNFIAKSPDKKADIIPTIIAHGEIEIATFPLIKSRLSYNAEPMIIGDGKQKRKRRGGLFVYALNGERGYGRTASRYAGQNRYTLQNAR